MAVAIEGQPEREAASRGDFLYARAVRLDAQNVALGITAPDSAIGSDRNAFRMMDSRLRILAVEKNRRARKWQSAVGPDERIDPHPAHLLLVGRRAILEWVST